MAVELPRPGVEIIQEFRSASPTIVRPTLIPFVCGPAKEVIEVTSSDGTLNSNAKQGVYSQLPRTIAQSSFPSPRHNIAEVDVDESTIRAFFNYGGSLLELIRDPGESFLKAWNESHKAAIQSIAVSTGFVLDGLILTLVLDQPSRTNFSRDIVVTFDNSGNPLTAQMVVDQINLAVGEDVAAIVGSGVTARVQITSSLSGALSSVTIRSGGTGNTGFLGSGTGTHEYRVVGAGFRGQDQSNNTTITPWIEWFRGGYYLDGVFTTFPAIGGTTDPGFGQVDHSAVFATALATALTFTGASSLDLKVGDRFYGDGVQPNGADIMKVEVNRFKLGTINTTLSTYDSHGRVTVAVYNASNVNTLLASAPYVPNYAWFKAENLTGNVAATAAALTGSELGDAALVAFVEGSSAPSGPFALTGMNLIVATTINGVTADPQTIIFTGPLTAMSDVVTFIGTQVPGMIAIDDSGKLKLATTRTGATQGLTLFGTSTALATLGFAAGDQTSVGHDVEFNAVLPVVATVGNSFASPMSLGTKTLVVKRSIDGGATWTAGTVTHTFSSTTYTTIDDVVADFTGDATFLAAISVSKSGSELVLTGKLAGHLYGIQIDTVTGTSDGASLLVYTAMQQDIGEDKINGATFEFQINDRPRTYMVIFSGNSLVDAVDSINAAVGVTVASIGGAGLNQLVMTSDLYGMASKVEVIDDTTSAQTNRALGFNVGNRTATGTGRPNPDFDLDISGSVVLGADILRNQVTGAPYDPGDADLYIQYTGLRKDLSPQAISPALLSIADVATLQTVLSPLTSDNPLGLGMFFAMVNAPGLVITGLGVSDAPAAAPMGTLAAYTEVANFIESQEVYAIAPMTNDETVAGMFSTHCVFMSGPEQKGERILIFNAPVPSREVDTVVGSGLSGNTSSTANQFIGDVNPAPAMLVAGINPANPIPVSADVFLEITVLGEVRRYNVSAVSGLVFTLNTTFTALQNTDGFFTTTTLSETLVNADWSMRVRGTSLLIPGSTLPDKDRIATTVAAKATAYRQRRMVYTFPDEVLATINGVEESLPLYYACAGISGMIAHYPPQQGFTNMPMNGFVGVVGSNDTFSNQQLNVMAAGGVYILIQDAQGAPIISRHQLTTDLTSIETRELSITKVVDYTAKFLRAGLRNFIGTFNITQPFLDTLGTVIHGMLKALEEQGVLISGDLNNIIQSTDAPDTVLVDVTLSVPYPCNYIRLTLVI